MPSKEQNRSFPFFSMAASTYFSLCVFVAHSVSCASSSEGKADLVQNTNGYVKKHKENWRKVPSAEALLPTTGFHSRRSCHHHRRRRPRCCCWRRRCGWRRPCRAGPPSAAPGRGSAVAPRTRRS